MADNTLTSETVIGPLLHANRPDQNGHVFTPEAIARLAGQTVPVTDGIGGPVIGMAVMRGDGTACVSLYDPSIADLTNAAYDAGYQFKTPPGYADEPEADAPAIVERPET